METALVDAYTAMLTARAGECSVDRILEDPELRGEFLARVQSGAAGRSEYDILRTLHNLRKRSKLPRRGEERTSA